MMFKLLPKVQKYGERFKSVLESSKVQDGTLMLLKSLAAKIGDLKLAKLSVDFYENCASLEKKQSLQTGMFKHIKDLCAILRQSKNKAMIKDILNEVTAEKLSKIHVLLLQLEFEIGDTLKIAAELLDIFQNNMDQTNESYVMIYLERFADFIRRLMKPNSEIELINVAINAAKLTKKVENQKMYKLQMLKYDQYFDKLEDYQNALETAQEMIDYSDSEKTLKYAVNKFVQTNLKGNLDKFVDSKSIKAKKFEARFYRHFSPEHAEKRAKILENLSKTLQDEEQIVFHVEMIWMELGKSSDLTKIVNVLEKLSKKAKKYKGIVHFWLGLTLWIKTRNELQNEVTVNKKDAKDQEESNSREKMLEIGDLTSIYSKVLDMNSHQEITKHLKESLDNLTKHPLKDELFNPQDLRIMKGIIVEMLDAANEKPKIVEMDFETTDALIETAWKLLQKGHFNQVQKILKYFKENLKNESMEDRIHQIELKLIKGQLILLEPNFETSESPFECARFAVSNAKVCLDACRKKAFSELSNIQNMFKTLNLSISGRNFCLEIFTSTGLSKEMRLYGKLCVDIGVETAMVPNLCHELLKCIEVDLLCDDSKQAQVKLREIECLMKEHLRSEPQKIKTKTQM